MSWPFPARTSVWLNRGRAMAFVHIRFWWTQIVSEPRISLHFGIGCAFILVAACCLMGVGLPVSFPKEGWGRLVCATRQYAPYTNTFFFSSRSTDLPRSYCMRPSTAFMKPTSSCSSSPPGHCRRDHRVQVMTEISAGVDSMESGFGEAPEV